MNTIPPILLELLRFSKLARSEPIRLRKNGLPGKRTFDRLVPQLSSYLGKETKGSFENNEYALFLYEMAYQLGLFREQNNHLYLQEMVCEHFFSLSIPQQLSALRDIWFKMVLWSEMLFAHHLVSSSQDPVFPIWVPKRMHFARKYLFHFLNSAVPSSTTVEEVIQNLNQVQNNILLLRKEGSNVYQDLVLVNEKEKRAITYPEDQEWVEEYFVRYVIQKPLHWLGLVRFEDSSQEHFSKNHEDVWGALETQHEEIFEPSLLVQPNLTILVFPNNYILKILYFLERFGVSVEGDRLLVYQLDEQSFLHALKEGITLDAIIHFLEVNSRVPVASNVKQILENWYQQASQVVISENCVLIEADTPEELEKVLQSLPEGVVVRKVSDTRFLIPPHQLKKMEKWVPPAKSIELNYANPPSRMFDVGLNLEISLLPQMADMHSIQFLKQFSDMPEKNKFKVCLEMLSSYVAEHKNHEKILSFFEDRARIFPSTERLRLESYCKQQSPVFWGDSPILVCSSAKQMERLLVEAGLKDYVVALGSSVAIAIPGKEEKVHEILKSFGLPNTQTLQPFFPASFSKKESASK